MPTVADVLKRIERLKKDLEYVRTFQEKWREQRDRFPKIYEGIVEQEKAFLRKIEELRNLKVEQPFGEPFGTDEPVAAPAPAGQPGAEEEAAAKPRIAPGSSEAFGGANGGADAPRAESSDEKRAAAAEIGEKLRKRGAGAGLDLASGAAGPAAPEPLAVKV
jgi:hypothetical protein